MPRPKPSSQPVPMSATSAPSRRGAISTMSSKLAASSSLLPIFRSCTCAFTAGPAPLPDKTRSRGLGAHTGSERAVPPEPPGSPPRSTCPFSAHAAHRLCLARFRPCTAVDARRKLSRHKNPAFALPAALGALNPPPPHAHRTPRPRTSRAHARDTSSPADLPSPPPSVAPAARARCGRAQRAPAREGVTAGGKKKKRSTKQRPKRHEA